MYKLMLLKLLFSHMKESKVTFGASTPARPEQIKNQTTPMSLI